MAHGSLALLHVCLSSGHLYMISSCICPATLKHKLESGAVMALPAGISSGGSAKTLSGVQSWHQETVTAIVNAIQPHVITQHTNHKTARPIIADNDHEGHEQRHLLP